MPNSATTGPWSPTALWPSGETGARRQPLANLAATKDSGVAPCESAGVVSPVAPPGRSLLFGIHGGLVETIINSSGELRPVPVARRRLGSAAAVWHTPSHRAGETSSLPALWGGDPRGAGLGRRKSWFRRLPAAESRSAPGVRPTSGPPQNKTAALLLPSSRPTASSVLPVPSGLSQRWRGEQHKPTPVPDTACPSSCREILVRYFEESGRRVM